MTAIRRQGSNRPTRALIGASALAATALFSTYLGGLRLAASYARASESADEMWVGPAAVPAGCAVGSTIVDDTVSLKAALAVGDDTVLCVVDSFTLDDTIVLDDTSLTLMGPDDTAVVLTSRADARHIVATSSAGSDDTLAIYNMTLAGQEQLGSGGIHFDGDFGANNADRVVLDDSTAIVDSFAAAGGAVDADANVYIGDAYFYGNFGFVGGVLATRGRLTIDGAQFFGSAGLAGGAINHRDDRMTLANVQLEGNAALSGGAIWASNSRVTIEQCVFEGNSADGYGGAIFTGTDVEALVVDNTTFAQNTADDSGGAIFFNSSSGTNLLSLSLTWFDDNYAPESGAIHSRGRLQIQGALFSGNDASVQAGAVGDDSGVLLIDTATFINNGDDTMPAIGGGLVSSPVGYVYLGNVTAVGNSSEDRGGFAYFRGGTIARPNEVTFSTVTGNSLVSGPSAGIEASATAVTSVINSVVHGNLEGAGTYDLYLPAAGSSLKYSFVTSADSVEPDSLESGTGVLFGSNPGLGVLTDNGGNRVGATGDDTYMPTRKPSLDSPLLNGATAASPSAQTLFDALGTQRSTTGPNAMGAVQVAAPVPPTPPAPIPASPPRDVSAMGGDRQVTVTWQAPASSGSFPVSTYQMQASPGGASCVVPATELTCVITGLTNGVEYTVRGRALTGAGWSAFSAASDPVTPGVEQTIVITGSRDGNRVVVEGVTTGLAGEQVTPWVRFPGPYSYEEGTGVRTVGEDGTFTWQRQTRKKIYVYFRAEDDVRSNRVIIRP